MPRYSFDQGDSAFNQDRMSCGAVASMVTLAELGILGKSDVSESKAREIFGKLQDPKGDGSPTARVAKYLLGCRCKVRVLENKTVIDAQIKADKSGKLGREYSHHSGRLSDALITAEQVGKFAMTHLDKDARVILVCVLAGSTNLHYVVLRKDGGKLWTMDPAGGQDKERKDAFFDFLNDPAKLKKFEDNRYLFTGVALHVTKA